MQQLFKHLILFVIESPSYERVFEPLKSGPPDFNIKVLRLYHVKNQALRALIRLFFSLRPNTFIVCCTAGFFLRPFNGYRLQIFHAPASFGATWGRKYLDNFDILGAVTTFQANQIRRLDPNKKMFELGLPYLDDACKLAVANDDLRYDLCYAPTYHIEISSIFSFLSPLVDYCRDNSLKLLIRPHPLLLQKEKTDYSGGFDWRKKLNKLSQDDLITIDFDSSYENVVTSAAVITDTSGLAYEFASVTRRPIGFIGEKLKVPLRSSHNFAGIYQNEVPEITARTSIGPIIKPPYDQKNIDKFLLELGEDHFTAEREQFFSQYIFNMGNATSIFWRYVSDLYEA